MENGLAVRADHAEPERIDAKFAAGAQRGLAEGAAEAEIQLTDFARRDARALGDAEYFGPHGRRKGHCKEILETRVCGIVRYRRRNAYERDVDAVDGSAGHQAKGKAGTFGRAAHKGKFPGARNTETGVAAPQATNARPKVSAK